MSQDNEINPPQSPLDGGIFTAVLTPLLSDFTVDDNLLYGHCCQMLELGSHGIALLGTTGEANSFSVHERIAILDGLVSRGFPPDRIMVGTGCCSLQETVQLTSHAVKKGVSSVLLLPPFYYKQVSNKGLKDYFDQFFSNLKDPALKVILYHFPKMSGIAFDHELIGALIEGYPQHVIGIKDSSGDLDNMKGMLQKFPGFRVFAGSEKFMLEVLKSGGPGCISATANVTVPLIRQVFDLFQKDIENKSENDHLISVREAFEGLPFSGALKSFLAKREKNASWATVRPPNLPLSAAQLEGLWGRLEELWPEGLK